jgi:multicomponent Na+:H+ antiporter subunit C
MTLLFAIAIGAIFMAGAYLLLSHDLIRVVAGIVLIGNAANLYIVGAALSRGEAPILPVEQGARLSDPLVQAMVLTAIVISFGVAALLLALVYRVYRSHLTLDTDALAGAEAQAAARDLAGAPGDERIAAATAEEAGEARA